MLREGWRLKKSLATSISNPRIDEIYNLAISCGAQSGKLLGAGGGGFLVFYVDPEHKENVIREMKDLLYVPFEFENGGTRVIHYTPESYIPISD